MRLSGTARGARAKFVLHDLDRGAISFKAHDTSSSDQPQCALMIELRGPVDRELDAAAGQERVGGAEQDSAAGDVDGLSLAGDLGFLTAENAVLHVALNRHAFGEPAI